MPLILLRAEETHRLYLRPASKILEVAHLYSHTSIQRYCSAIIFFTTSTNSPFVIGTPMILL